MLVVRYLGPESWCLSLGVGLGLETWYLVNITGHGSPSGLGHSVELAPAGRRASQTAAALLATGVVVVVEARLTDACALIARLVTQDFHQFLQLTSELIVIITDVSTIFSGVSLMMPGTDNSMVLLTPLSIPVSFHLFICHNKRLHL